MTRSSAEGPSEAGLPPAVAAALPDVILLTDVEGRIVLATGAVESLLGYPADELLGSPVERLVPGAAREAHRAHRERYQADPRPRPMGAGLELEAAHRDGRPVPVDIMLSTFGRGKGLRVISVLRDARLRRELQGRLADSEARYADLFQRSSEAVFVTTREGRVVDANPACARLLGLDPSALPGLDAGTFYAESGARERFMALVEETGSIRDHPVDLRARPDGRLLHCLMSATVRRDERGEVAGYQGILHDVTAQTRRQRALTRLNHGLSRIARLEVEDDDLDRSLRRLSAIVTEALQADGVGLWAREPEGDALHRIAHFGHAGDESSPPRVRTRSDASVCFDVMASMEVGVVEDVMATGDGEGYFRRRGVGSVMVAPLPAGSRARGVLTCECVGRPRRWSPDERQFGQAVAAMVSALVDRDERRRAERALRTSEAHLRRAQEAAEMGSWEWSVVTDEIAWSPGVFRIFGADPGLSPTFADFVGRVDPRDRAAVEDAVGAALRGERGYDVVHRIRTEDGEVRWVREVGEVDRDDSGWPVRMVGVVMDVTRTKRMEETFRQVQRMEAIGRMAGGVAHDFNNLLTATLGNLDLALEDAEPGSDLHEAVTDARAAAVRGRALTRQLLAVSRQQELELRAVALNDLVVGMVRVLSSLVGDGVELEVLPDEALGPVRADPTQVEQVILNLVVNAGDALPEGGMIRVTTGRAEREGATWARLSVEDTGDGIDPDVLPRVFEPFFTTKGEGKGTGLGLATVYGIVTQSGGHVDVRSEPGVGTRFDVFFPLA